MKAMPDVAGKPSSSLDAASSPPADAPMAMIDMAACALRAVSALAELVAIVGPCRGGFGKALFPD
ncbi:hypothetical protein IP81_11295 [Novosphingobium sp. AAP83]|nr:hypothetical protein IP81_11295 [Novosphingobium sp. AAP83]